MRIGVLLCVTIALGFASRSHAHPVRMDESQIEILGATVDPARRRSNQSFMETAQSRPLPEIQACSDTLAFLDRTMPNTAEIMLAPRPPIFLEECLRQSRGERAVVLLRRVWNPYVFARRAAFMRHLHPTMRAGELIATTIVLRIRSDICATAEQSNRVLLDSGVATFAPALVRNNRRPATELASTARFFETDADFERKFGRGFTRADISRRFQHLLRRRVEACCASDQVCRSYFLNTALNFCSQSLPENQRANCGGAGGCRMVPASLPRVPAVEIAGQRAAGFTPPLNTLWFNPAISNIPPRWETVESIVTHELGHSCHDIHLALVRYRDTRGPLVPLDADDLRETAWRSDFYLGFSSRSAAEREEIWGNSPGSRAFFHRFFSKVGVQSLETVGCLLALARRTTRPVYASDAQCPLQAAWDQAGIPRAAGEISHSKPINEAFADLFALLNDPKSDVYWEASGMHDSEHPDIGELAQCVAQEPAFRAKFAELWGQRFR